MNKKGFTLIELLAVIVILAIIALIATPIVLSIINDVKQSAIVRSAEFYVDAVQNKIMQENMELGGKLKPNECEVVNEGKELDCDGTILEIEVDGETPDEGSLITFDRGKVTSINLIYGNKVVSQNEKGQLVLGDRTKSCTLTNDQDSDGIADVGDMITCSTESFYVIENDGKKISMFAQYSLEVGGYWEVVEVEVCGTEKNCDVGDCYYCRDEWREDFITKENPTGIQIANILSITYSSNNYWYDNSIKTYIIDSNYIEEGRQYPFVYGDYAQNNIYKYVEQYEQYLKSQNVMSASATLISYEQIQDLINNKGNPEWIYTVEYWTGSAYNEYSIWAKVFWDDEFVAIGYMDLGDFIEPGQGIRPVVNISVNEL